MPMYSYTTLDGETVELQFSMEKQPKSVTLAGGVVAQRDVVADFVTKPQDHKKTWPMHSDALGCNPDQIAESRAASLKAGVPTDFDRIGRAILRNPKHRRDYAKLYGIHDRNGGYSDP